MHNGLKNIGLRIRFGVNFALWHVKTNMIKSMTGYGSATGEFSGGELSLEIKSVNGRYLDCNFHIPKILSQIQESMNQKIKNYLNRGNITLYLTVQKKKLGDKEPIVLNHKRLDEYLSIFEEIRLKTGGTAEPNIMHLIRLPDVIMSEIKEETTEELKSAVAKALDEALNELESMQLREGEALERVFKNNLDIIRERAQEINTKVKNRRERLFGEFRKKIESLTGKQVEEERIVTEAGILAEKLDISEELDRLASHLTQFDKFLTLGEPIGKRLNFLLQEMSREVNTIGSKANDIYLSHIIVDMKNGLEIMREQVQNVA